MNITITINRRYNLGNYEHVDGKIEVVLPPCSETEFDRKVSAVQAMILRHLTVEALTGGKAQPVPQPAAAPPQPVPQPQPQPAAPSTEDLKELRARITKAVASDTALQARVIEMLAEAGLARLKDAPAELLHRIAAEVGAA